MLPDDWTTTTIRETGERVLGVSSGRKTDKDTWKSRSMYIERNDLRRRTQRTEESRQKYREMQRKEKMEETKAEQRTCDDLYAGQWQS